MSASDLRQSAQDAAKRHKASWIELGQFLFTIHKEKHYREWGFISFEAYCLKELGVKQSTAAKLLKSYYFLEKEEPALVRPEYTEEETPAQMPNYESVNLLRLARQNEAIKPRDFALLREAVIEKAKEPKEVRAQVKKIMDLAARPRDPAEQKRRLRYTAIRRLLSILSSTRRELESEDLVPDYLLKQIGDLARKLEDQIKD